MKKGLTIGLWICFLLALAALATAPGQAEAAGVTAANRELKKSRDYQHSPLYERAHRIIYGNGTPLGPQGRVRIAIIIDGDESIIVEDRVKNEIYQAIRQKFPRESFAVMKGIDVKTRLLQYAEDSFDDNNRPIVHTGEEVTTKTDTGGFGVLGGGGIGAWDRGYNPEDFGRTGYGGFGLGGMYGNHQTKNREWTEKSDRADVDGLSVHRNKPRGLADMRRGDYVRAGRECDYDYVFVASFTKGNYQVERHNWVVYQSATKKQNIWLCLRFVDTQSGDYVYRNDLVMTGEVGDQSGRPKLYQRAVRNAMREAMDDLEVDIY